MKIKFDIINPGGNITALVNRNFGDAEDASILTINNLIMKKYPVVEQVGFYKEENALGGWRLDMAGGEFCGNALRSLAYLKLVNSATKTFFSVSGTDKILEAGVNKKGNVYAYLPTFPGVTETRKIDANNTYIKLEGIEFIVSSLKCFPEKNTLESKAKYFLNNAMVTSQSPASGIIFAIKTDKSAYIIDPFIYVKLVDTFINETACASGSVAMALVLNCPGIGLSTVTRIKQPSNNYLEVEIKRGVDNIESIKVSGVISYYMSGEICL